MQLQSEFSKMQFLLIGNRFSGVNLSKTRFDLDVQTSKKLNGISFTIVFSTEIDYTEVDEKIKYLQHATTEIAKAYLNSNALDFLKTLTIQLQDDFFRRYTISRVFKTLQLPFPDRLSDEVINNRITRIVTDYNNGLP